MKRAASNSKDEFANSPDLKDALMYEILDALDAHHNVLGSSVRVWRPRP